MLYSYNARVLQLAGVLVFCLGGTKNNKDYRCLPPAPVLFLAFLSRLVFNEGMTGGGGVDSYDDVLFMYIFVGVELLRL